MRESFWNFRWGKQGVKVQYYWTPWCISQNAISVEYERVKAGLGLWCLVWARRWWIWKLESTGRSEHNNVWVPASSQLPSTNTATVSGLLRRISRPTSESSSRELNLSSLASLLNGEQPCRDEQTCKEEEEDDEEGRPEINCRLGNLAPEELGLTFNWSTRDENQIFHKLLKLTDNIPRHNKIKNIYWLEDTFDNKIMDYIFHWVYLTQILPVSCKMRPSASKYYLRQVPTEY